MTNGLENLRAILDDQPYQNSALSVFEINLILANEGGFMPDEAVAWFRASRGSFVRRERMWCRACGTVTADETCDCNRYGQTICEPDLVNYADAMRKSARELAQENATLTARVAALEAARRSQRSQHRQMRDAINDVGLAINDLQIDSVTSFFETADNAAMVKVPLGALRRLARCYLTLNRIIDDPAFEEINR